MKRALSTMAFLLLASLAIACAGQGYAAPKPNSADFSAGGPQRENCNEIMGTPFRSVEERRWFEEKCSKWPATSFGNMAIAKAAPDSPQCAAMRGRPYRSDAERQWFLTNCPGTGGGPAASAMPPEGTNLGPDRTDCNAIRGTVYRSYTEQAWYLQNCSGVAGPATAAGQLPVQLAPAPSFQLIQPATSNNSGQPGCNGRSNGRGGRDC